MTHYENGWGTKVEPKAPQVSKPIDEPEFNLSYSIPQFFGELLMCGICERPAHLHIDQDTLDFTELCDRNYAEWTMLNTESYSDYWLSPNGIAEAIDYTGPGIEETVTEYDTSEFESLDQWTDKHPDEYTSAIKYWHGKNGQILGYGTYNSTHVQFHGNVTATNNLISEQDRNVYVESTEGFISRKLLDEELTKKYHDRLLNLHLYKGRLTCGLVGIESHEQFVSITCYHKDCYTRDAFGNYSRNSKSIDVTTATREQMEEFVYSIISHGNNHGPEWYTTRDTYYRISDFLPAVAESNELTDVEFVMEHNSICKDPNCKCTEWLASEVPSLINQGVAA